MEIPALNHPGTPPTPSPAIRAGQIRVDKTEPGNNQGPLRRLNTEHKLPSKHSPAGSPWLFWGSSSKTQRNERKRNRS